MNPCLVCIASAVRLPAAWTKGNVACLHGAHASKESLPAEAFDQIRQNAAGNVVVITRSLHALETLAGQTANDRQRPAAAIAAATR